MKARSIAALFAIAALSAACADLTTSPERRLVMEPDFQEGDTDGWQVGFADLPEGDTESYELEHSIRALPTPLDGSRRALYVQGHNRSDDLFMFLTRVVSGLAPGATYDVRFEIQLASNAGTGCVGAGGAPGESVYLKAGAVGFAPLVVTEEDGWRRVNFDKGNQAAEGAHARILGDVANGSDRCDDAAPYRLKTLTSAGESIRATADPQGRIWLVVGTDSGYEGLTALYYPSIRVTVSW